MAIPLRLCLHLLWLIGFAWLFSPTTAYAATIPEQEPNDTAQTAQLLSAIGLDNPVAAEIHTPGNLDWYKFEVVTGRSYVVEVYNLDVGLGRAGGGNCERFANHSGLGLVIHDSSVTELRRQCAPWAGGNVQNSLLFKATATGLFTLAVVPQSSAANVSLAAIICGFSRTMMNRGQRGTTIPPNRITATKLLMKFYRG